MLLKEGETIQSDKGAYQVRGKIGSESSFGAVFKVLDGEGTPRVIKQLLGPAKISQDVGMDYDYVRLTFEREAKILISHNHDQIVKGFDFFSRDQELFLVMEFINGEDLDQLLIKHMEENNGLPFPEGVAVPIGYELCGIIHAIHQLPGQVLYRDLKPRNVMWDAQNQILTVIDFGTARFMSGSAHSTQALGTPGYAPPEFYNTTSPLSFASDVYTIGATLFELVTGEVAEPLMAPAHYHGQEAQLSEELREIIGRAMAQSTRARFQTAEEMGRALERLASFSGRLHLRTGIRNPFPYLSCLCTRCGGQPQSDQSVFCSECGGKIHVMLLRITPQSTHAPSMDLFLEKNTNLIGRLDMESQIFPDVDLSRFDPECYVSRRHALMKRDGTRFFIEALNATNPSLIGGFPLKSGRSVEIHSQTEMGIGNLKVTFIIKPCID